MELELERLDGLEEGIRRRAEDWLGCVVLAALGIDLRGPQSNTHKSAWYAHVVSRPWSSHLQADNGTSLLWSSLMSKQGNRLQLKSVSRFPSVPRAVAKSCDRGTQTS